MKFANGMEYDSGLYVEAVCCDTCENLAEVLNLEPLHAIMFPDLKETYSDFLF